MSDAAKGTIENRFVPITQTELFKRRKEIIISVFKLTRSIGMTSRIMNITSYPEIYFSVSQAGLLPAPAKSGPIPASERAEMGAIPQPLTAAIKQRKLTVRRYLRLLSARFETVVHECDFSHQLLKGMDDQIAQDLPEAYPEVFGEPPPKRGSIAPAFAGEILLKKYKNRYLCLVPKYRIISAGKTQMAARRYAMKLVVLAAQIERGENYLKGITGEKKPARMQPPNHN